MADKDFVVKNGLVTGTNNVTLGNAVYITATGNVGIGNSAPVDKLSVGGKSYFGDSISSAINLTANTTGVYHTGTVNAASHTVGTSTIANSTGVYTGVVNATGVTVSANLTVAAAGELVLTPGAGLYANGSLGTALQVLHSNGSSVYWGPDDNTGGTVTSVGTGNGLTGGPVTTSGTVSVLPNTGIVANTGGLYVNATYIGTLSANNTTYVNGKTEGNLNVNSAVQATNATNLNSQPGSYYTNATNISTGTLALARGGSNSSLTAVSGGVVYSNATGMAITAAGTNTYILTSNGTAPVWSQIDMDYLPDSTLKKSCRAATTADLSAASATTQVLTGGLVALPAQDGITLVLNDRLLVWNQSNTAQNGIYNVSNTGSAGVYAWTLTRSGDANTSIRIASALVAVDEGTTNGGKLFDNDFKITDTIGTTVMPWSYNIDSAGGVFVGSVYPNSNTSLLGNANARWVISANTINASGLITGSGGATITGTTNTSTAFYVGATLVANATGPYGKTEATLNVNSAVQATNATNLNSQPGSYYTNATNISTGTLALARGGTASALTAVSGGVVYSNATGMAITAAGTNTYVLASNGTAPVFTQIDMSYLPESTFKKSVRAATTADLSVVTATAQVLTGANVAFPAQDGITLVLNDRLLVKNQSNTAQNGIFFVSNTGTATTYPWTLTRVNDANTSSKIASDIVAVDEGTTNGGKIFTNYFKPTDTIGTSVMPWYNVIDSSGGTFAGAISPNSNTLLLGNPSSRWVVSANTIDASGLITGSGGATITGTTNTSTAFQISTTFIANTTGVYHTGTVNAASHTVGTSTIANSTGVYTGVVNATSVNAASHTVGTSTIANATGVYTGVVNAASHTVGTSTIANATGVYTGVVNGSSITVGTAWTANTTRVVFGTAVGLQANGGIGSASQALFSNGTTVYWANVSSGTSYTKGNQGAVGSPSNANNIFRINANTVSNNITFDAQDNAMAVGPLTIGTGNTITISTGARVVII